MPTNNNFYNLNSMRSYPFDDGATCIDDAGHPLPTDLLVDCCIRFPRSLGRYLFVTSLTVTDGIATAIFAASPRPAVPRLQDRLIYRPTAVCASNWNHTGAIAKLSEDIYPPYGVGDGLEFSTVGQTGTDGNVLGLNFNYVSLLGRKFREFVLWLYLRAANVPPNAELHALFVADGQVQSGWIWEDLDHQLDPNYHWVRAVLRDPPIIDELSESGMLLYRPTTPAYDLYLDTVLTEAIPADWDTLTPVAAVSVPRRDLRASRQYAVEPLAPGVGGWVVWGDGIDEPYTGRFSTIEQSQILARCGSAYRDPIVSSIGKLQADRSLTGVIALKPGADIGVTAETWALDGADQTVAVVRLVDRLDRNVLDLYTGPCGGRPETRNCDRTPVEYLNTVAPDCYGNITIDFQHLTVRPTERGSGELVLDFDVGLTEACTRADRLPDADGNLPNDYVDLCAPPPAEFCYESASSMELLYSLSSLPGSLFSYELSSESHDSIDDNAGGMLQLRGHLWRLTGWMSVAGDQPTQSQPSITRLNERIYPPMAGTGNAVHMYYYNIVEYKWRLGYFAALENWPDPYQNLAPVGQQHWKFNSVIAWIRGFGTDPTYPISVGISWLDDAGVLIDQKKTIYPPAAIDWFAVAFTPPSRAVAGLTNPTNAKQPILTIKKPTGTNIILDSVFVEMGRVDPSTGLPIPLTDTDVEMPAVSVRKGYWTEVLKPVYLGRPAPLRLPYSRPARYRRRVACQPEQESLPSVSSESSLSMTSIQCGEPPFYDSFDGPDFDPRWVVQEGEFAIVHADSEDEPEGSWASSVSYFSHAGGVTRIGHLAPVRHALNSEDTSRRNLLLWEDCRYSTTNIYLRTHLRMIDFGEPHRNGGLVVNYQLSPIDGRPRYFFVRLDHAGDALRIEYYNGSQLAATGSTIVPLGLHLNHWYELRVAVEPLGQQMKLTAEVTDLTYNVFLASLVATTSRYGEPDGRCGLMADKSYTQFAFFELYPL